MTEIIKILAITKDEFIVLIFALLLIVFLILVSIILYLKLKKYSVLFKKLLKAFRIDSSKIKDKTGLIDEFIENQKNLQPPSNTQMELISQYIEGNIKENRILIHFTPNRKRAERILSEGFMYNESIYKTTQEIVDSNIDLKYKIQLFKAYGKFIITILIPNPLFKEIIDNAGISEIDNLLSRPADNEDFEFILKPDFIHSYIDLENNKIVENNHYLINRDISEIMKKLKSNK